MIGNRAELITENLGLKPRNPKAMKFDVETNQFEAEDAVCEGGRKYDIYGSSVCVMQWTGL
ncbi:hypothetical protein H6F92_02975 [Microcystis wesenbergii FACHB-1317]|uniref:hypothetical protein n=1 Tax=Microcystis TaxID=1125 RepID=UPI000E3A4DFF|nr:MULTISPECIES: hypothetical protein [Microcystis]MBD2287846.1 hypothetical protein [Microcystis wesenbergii FACHB-1317]REJ48881.1 MAG: hypothetical protein DWQ58_17405 [Microcystis aeruginosa TA09]UZO79129.1 hypothetical protein M8120_27585 [Microcystis aeruginosa str. Chao 1910]